MLKAGLNRRTFLASIVACAAVEAGSAAPDFSGLNSLARRSGRYFGSMARLASLGDRSLANALVRDCSVLTPELALKWAAIEARRGELSLSAIDDFASFAKKHGQKVHGHALLWGRSIPDWAAADLEDSRDWGLIRKHFASVIPRFGDVIMQWDVVNEPIDTGRRMDGLRENAFIAAFGPSYIERALDDARMFAPQAKLLINEYGLEYELPVERDRRYLFLKLVERLKARGSPLDGVGLQAHLDLGKGPLRQATIERFLADLADLDVFILISELDVKESDYTLPPDERDRRVAEAARAYLDVALANPAVRGLTTWGLSDRQTWLEVTDEDRARFPSAWQDGTSPGLNRGLPLDAALMPKPLYRAIAGALRAAAPRS